MQNVFQARVWILIERAADVPGEWVSHCLDFDAVSQGRSIREALQAVQESVLMIVVDDVERGVDPRTRRAPEEYWNRLSKMLDHADKVPGGALPADDSTVAAFAVEIVFIVQKVTPAEVALHQVPMQPAPVMEMAFAVQEQRVA